MPLYEYVCIDCNNRFETLVLSSEEEVCCPACESRRLEKIMSTFSLAAGSLSGGCSSGTGFS